MQNTKADHFSFNLIHSAYVGFALLLYNGVFRGKTEGLPIFDFSQLIQLSHPWILVALLVTALFAIKPIFRRLFYTLTVIFLSLYILSFFTAWGAFNQLVVLGFLYLLFLKNQSLNAQRFGAQVLIGGMFIFAGLHKINPQFLAGAEFLPEAPFSVWLRTHGVVLKDLLPHTALLILPIITILVEMFLGLSLLLFPRLGAIAAIYFCLVLNTVYPEVIFVYLAILPFLFLLYPEHFSWHKNYRPTLLNPFLWFFLSFTLFSISVYSYGSLQIAIIFNAFNLCLISLHTYLLFRDQSYKSLLLRTSRPKHTIHSSLFTLIIIIYLSLPFIGAPSPIGFSMLAGSYLKPPQNQILINQNETCWRIKNRYPFSSIQDLTFRNEGTGCSIGFPTRSSLKYFESQLCHFFNSKESLTWIRIADSKVHCGCEDRGPLCK